MIPILCMSCGTHILNTDSVRLHFPFSGEMFDPAVEGFYLRPGYLNLDIWCPRCLAFPFYPNGTSQGFKGLGNLLKTIGTDGKPAVLPVDEIKKLQSGAPETPSRDGSPDNVISGLGQPAISAHVEKVENPGQKLAEFPCSECGAKKRFHKKTCPHSLLEKRKISIAAAIHREYETDEDILEQAEEIVKARQQEPEPEVPQWLILQVEKADAMPPDAPPTREEIAELAMERESKAGKNDNSLRPMTQGV